MTNETNNRPPKWRKWRLMPEIKEWEAVALSLNIEPDKINLNSNAWMGAEHPFNESEEFIDRLMILKNHSSNRAHFPTPCKLNMANWYECEVRLDEFAAWCIHVDLEIPPELSALAKAIQTAPKSDDSPARMVEAVAVTPPAPAAQIDEINHDAKLAALFDPVPVEALAKTFTTDPSEAKSLSQWQKWAGRAKREGLDDARTSRGRFNLYKAGQWFIHKGACGWNEAKLLRVLANNLPARSRDEKHLLTGDMD